MAAAVRERELDVVHSHQYSPFFYVALSAKAIYPRPRLILTYMVPALPGPRFTAAPGREPHRPGPPRRRRDRVLSLQRRGAVAVRRVRGRANQIIENGIEVDRYGPAAHKRGLKAKLGLEPDRATRFMLRVITR